MATTITINGQEYIIETGTGGYTYYRVASTQRFGKKVKAKNGYVGVWNATTGTPNPTIGLNALTWGKGTTASPAISASYELADVFPDDVRGFYYFNGYYYVSYGVYIYRSSDLSTWNLVYTEPRGEDFGGFFEFNNTLYTSTLWGADVKIYGSSDGTTWTEAFDTGLSTFEGYISAAPYWVVADNTLFLLSYADGIIYTSDGITWTLDTSFNTYYFTGAVAVNDLVYGIDTDGVAVIIDPNDISNPTIYDVNTSLGTSFEDLQGLIYYKGYFYLIDYAETGLMRSTDFNNWELVPGYTAPTYNVTTFSDGISLFIVCDNGSLYKSEDGTTWELFLDYSATPYDREYYQEVYKVGDDYFMTTDSNDLVYFHLEY